MSGVKANLGYQTVYQIINTCIPLITSPYLSRVLGADMLGVFSYTQSIVNYFTLIAMLGITSYGTRQIAACKNKYEVSNVFWNIYIIQFITSSICIGLYICYIFVFCKGYVVVSILQGFYLIGSLLDINWLFFGLEKFKLTVTRNMIVRIISVICIFTFVKSQSDISAYTLIMAGSIVVSNLILWRFVGREVELHIKQYINIGEISRIIKPIIVLFVPLLAMSIYHIMDKTMLGYFSTYTETGYYYNADKIINIPLGVLSGIGTVLLPRISKLCSVDNNTNEADLLFKKSLEGTIMIAAALAGGIAAISWEFTPIFFGYGYEPCITLIICLSPVLIIKGFSFSVRYQFLIPRGYDSIYLKSVSVGAAINLVVNLILIPQCGALGAVLGTIVAETMVCLWQFIAIRKFIDNKKNVIQCMVYVVFSILMFFAVRGVALLIDSGVISLMIEIVVGVVVYSLLLLIYGVTYGKHSVATIVIDVLKNVVNKLGFNK